MKLFQADFEKSERLAIQYASFDVKNKPTEQDIDKANRKILEAKKEFDESKIMHPENVREYFTKLEIAEIEKRQLTQNYINAKDKLAGELRAITTPVILGFSEELMAELKRLDAKKTFSVIKDIINSELQRVFKCSHNYFAVHECQKRIMAVIEILREMSCSSLGEIKKVYDEGIQGIPETFQLEITIAGEEFKSFIFDNRAKEPSSGESKTIWMNQTQFLSELENKVKDWKKEKDQKVVEGLVNKYQGPIEIDMT
jgi:hypothetical protein